jgi:hypothetical protein
MKRLAIAAALLLTTALSAYADHPDVTYHDLIRPNGQPRSDAVFNAAVAACKRITHDSKYSDDSPAMKRCMLKRGYAWESTRWIEDQPESSSTVDWTDFLKWEQ